MLGLNSLMPNLNELEYSFFYNNTLNNAAQQTTKFNQLNEPTATAIDLIKNGPLNLAQTSHATPLIAAGLTVSATAVNSAPTSTTASTMPNVSHLQSGQWLNNANSFLGLAQAPQ
jgi:hypothetical protein